MRQINGAQRGTGPLLSLTEQFRAQRQDTLFYNLLALVIAVSATLALYLGVSLSYNAPPLASFLGRAPDVNLPWIPSLLLSRGILQPLNFTLFGFGVTLLLLRLWIMRRDFKAFDHPYFINIPTNEQKDPIIGEESRLIPLENVKQIAREYSGSLPVLIRRLEAGSRRLAEEGDATQIHAVMQAVADIDREALESRYTLVRYLIWLIPTIGFLGTVIGIGRAIAGFTGFMLNIGRSGGDFQAQLQQILSGVSGQLGVAFDTTVLALFLSAIIVAMVSIVQSREEGLLSSIDDFCLRNFISRITVPDFGTKHMSATLQNALVSVSQAVGRQRPTKPEEAKDFSWRDLAGLLTSHTEQIKDALLKSGRGASESEILTTIQKSAESIAASSDKISRVLESWKQTGNSGKSER